MERKLVAIVLVVILITLSTSSLFSLSSESQKDDTSPEITYTLGSYSHEPGYIRANVIKNSGFENVNPNDIPSDLDGYTNGYVYTTANYTDIVANGIFSGFIAAQVFPLCTAGYETSHISADLPDTPQIFLDTGVSISFNWYVPSCPSDGSHVYVGIYTLSDAGPTMRVRYYLSSASAYESNSSSYANYHISGDTGTWYHLERNITADYLSVFGTGSIDISRYIASVTFVAVSEQTNADVTSLVFDDVILDNGVSSDWIENGDFEQNDYSGWVRHVLETPTYITQSTECTAGHYSLNLTSGFCNQSAANCHIGQDLPYLPWQTVHQEGTILRFDWKYSWTESAKHRTWLRVILRNDTSSASVHFVLGNSTPMFFEENTFFLNETESSGIWQHTELGIGELANACNLNHMWIDRVEFYLLSIHWGAVSLLVDNLQVIIPAVSNPGFECIEDDCLGWYTGGLADVIIDPESYSGAQSLRITAQDNEIGYITRDLYSGYCFSDFLQFAWRLENIAMNSSTCAYAYIRIGSDHGLRLVLGSSSAVRWVNSSYIIVLMIGEHNVTDQWHFLSMSWQSMADIFNLTESELQSSFCSIQFYIQAAENETISLLVDDIAVLDLNPPDVNFNGTRIITEGFGTPRLSWTMEDAHPYKYELFVNTLLNHSSPWYSTSDSVNLELENLTIGYYNLTLLAIDMAGNAVVNQVDLQVVSTTLTNGNPGHQFNTGVVVIAVVSTVVIVIFVPLSIREMKSARK